MRFKCIYLNLLLNSYFKTLYKHACNCGKQMYVFWKNMYKLKCVLYSIFNLKIYQLTGFKINKIIHMEVGGGFSGQSLMQNILANIFYPSGLFFCFVLFWFLFFALSKGSFPVKVTILSNRDRNYMSAQALIPFLVSVLWLAHSYSEFYLNDSYQPSVDHMLWWVELLSAADGPSGVMLTK